MQIHKKARNTGTDRVVVKRPLVVLDAAAIAQVSGGGPNGGWGAETAATPHPVPGSSAGASTDGLGGPNGGWAVTTNGQQGPNGGW